MKTHSFRMLIVAAGLSLAASSPVFANDAEDMFKKMDINGDGKVTDAEHSHFSDTMFRQSDADRDGKVSAAECEAAQAAHDGGMKTDKAATQAHLQKVDTDGDGTINRTENAAFGRSEFKKADKDGDGSLTEDEVEAAHKAMKKEMKG